MVGDRRPRRWRLKWLEIASVSSTMVITVGGVAFVRGLAHSVAPVFSDFGASLPTPTQRVLDWVASPLSPALVVVVLPTALALLGAWANGRGQFFLGPVLLVAAPVLASLEVLGATLALYLPFNTVVTAWPAVKDH
jgi:hypothetical protein